MQHTLKKNLCFHCGDACSGDSVSLGDKLFCCTGCKLVYEILEENNLCTYYNLNEQPGVKTSNIISNRYSYLDEISIVQKLISYKNNNQVHVTFQIPD
ncbi:MAG TPA: heavy metal translocating P-type ATPase metal-binding domain-containing protein, partial [Bacteroidia bacterium]|nr:heavy metal translocating P-type ATPase metal-binding domain-containing protein [Bacteroidia bacterium]